MIPEQGTRPQSLYSEGMPSEPSQWIQLTVRCFSSDVQQLERVVGRWSECFLGCCDKILSAVNNRCSDWIPSIFWANGHGAVERRHHVVRPDKRRRGLDDRNRLLVDRRYGAACRRCIAGFGCMLCHPLARQRNRKPPRQSRLGSRSAMMIPPLGPSRYSAVCPRKYSVYRSGTY